MNPNRRNWLKKIGLGTVVAVLAQLNIFASSGSSLTDTDEKGPVNQHSQDSDTSKLGAFSMSLNVKDLKASIQFYENLGFKIFGGKIEANYVIMKNGNSLIGLFHGMFNNNIMTFNPGWDENANKIEPFDDIRKIQLHLKGKGVKFESEADVNTKGPASFIILDPDGNTILIDQHV
jgi:catechol 2,3-dioxygenase-like lactoylglutathione lyase family enzyme